MLTINPKSSKAFYRAALALISLRREDEALDGCDRCLQFDPSNNSLKVVRERASNALKLKRAAENVRKEREQKERDRKAALDRAFAVSFSVLMECRCIADHIQGTQLDLGQGLKWK